MDKDDLYSEMDNAIDDAVEAGKISEADAMRLKSKIQDVLFH